MQFYVSCTEWPWECCRDTLKDARGYNTHFCTVFKSKELCKIQCEQNVDMMTILLMAEETEGVTCSEPAVCLPGTTSLLLPSSLEGAKDLREH